MPATPAAARTGPGQRGAACSWSCRRPRRPAVSRLGAGDDIPIGTPVAGPGRTGAGGPGRLLRQYSGAAHRRLGRPQLPRAAGPGARVRPGGLRASGPAVRAAGGGTQPGRSLARHPLFQVCWCCRTRRSRVVAAGADSARAGRFCDVAKFDLTLDLVECLGPERDRRGSRGLSSLARTCSSREQPNPSRRGWCGCWKRRWRCPTQPLTGSTSWMPASGTLLEGVQRHGASGARGDAAGAVRGPGGTNARGRGGGVRGRVVDVWRAERAGQPPGAPPDRAGCGAGVPWWASAWSVVSTWWWRSWPSSRRAAPTCRWTRSIPRERLAFMLGDAGRRSC